MSYPTESHLFLVKRILRYIQGILHCGIIFQPSPDTQLSAYSNSDWAADISTQRSQTSYVVFFFCPNPVSWQSKKQSSVFRSSTEDKYKTLAHCAADVSWLQNILKDLHVFVHSPPLIHCDDIYAFALSTNYIFHSRIKHLDTDFHFVHRKFKGGSTCSIHFY